MSHFGHENHDRQTDEYGNPIHHTAGGNTGAHVTHAGGEYGTGAYGTQTGGEYGTGGNTGGAYGTQSGGDQYGTGTLGHEIEKKGHGQGGILHRSKSSSSSSSEDDGEGGRRKKSIKEKIKEKIPGGNKPKTEGQDAYAHGHGHGATTTHQEGHGHDSGYGGATTTHETYVAHGTDVQPEKKGFMEKIKEKLPGHHNAEGN